MSDLETITADPPKIASKPVWWILAIALGSTGGGGAWALQSTDHERDQDERIERNGRQLRRIAVLLVQQGRHVDLSIRAVSQGRAVPDRPPSLNAIESAILSEPSE